MDSIRGESCSLKQALAEKEAQQQEQMRALKAEEEEVCWRSFFYFFQRLERSTPLAVLPDGNTACMSFDLTVQRRRELTAQLKDTKSSYDALNQSMQSEMASLQLQYQAKVSGSSLMRWVECAGF